jgi:hypothetical protein
MPPAVATTGGNGTSPNPSFSVTRQQLVTKISALRNQLYDHERALRVLDSLVPA